MSKCVLQTGMFAQGSWHDSLRHVLEAYVAYAPELGYVQGMSYLAAVLLIMTNSDESVENRNDEHGDVVSTSETLPNCFPAFCCLCNLLEQPARILKTCLQLDDSTMPSLFDFWDRQMRLSLPDLHGHFDKLGLSPALYLVEWIFTLFAKSLPLEPVAWLWDRILVLGDRAIFEAAIGLLSLLEKAFLAMSGVF
eukprot:SAG31_NODE_1976_length_6750_cov_8.060893_5_plen_194_part_00